MKKEIRATHPNGYVGILSNNKLSVYYKGNVVILSHTTSAIRSRNDMLKFLASVPSTLMRERKKARKEFKGVESAYNYFNDKGK